MDGFKFLYWHWLVFGMVLMMLELIVPSFTILWFGLGGLVVGLILLVLAEIPFTWQVLIWVASSVGFTIIWFKILKPRMKDQTMAGISREAVLGETAMIISKPVGQKRGQLRFAVPVLGSETWDYLCDKQVDVGDRVVVHEVSGNTMIVRPAETKHNQQEG